jgi:hypothetical protein
MNLLPNGIGSAAALGSLTLGTVAAITLADARAMTTAALERVVHGIEAAVDKRRRPARRSERSWPRVSASLRGEYDTD